MLASLSGLIIYHQTGVIGREYRAKRCSRCRPVRETEGPCGAPSRTLRRDKEHRNNDYALKGTFLEKINTVAPTAT